MNPNDAVSDVVAAVYVGLLMYLPFVRVVPPVAAALLAAAASLALSVGLSLVGLW